MSDDSRYLLYTFDNEERIVFELRDGEVVETIFVAERPVSDPDGRYDLNAADYGIPEDLEAVGFEITEAQMRELTGYYLGGRQALDEAAVQLSRVRPDDPYGPFCQAMLNLLQGTPPDRWGAA
ncbi:MAG: hypothetical protein JXA57_07120 [Armatimonadetes bacterium]|nr:hypothetical protein [Armatimonadota bacterium]